MERKKPTLIPLSIKLFFADGPQKITKSLFVRILVGGGNYIAIFHFLLRFFFKKKTFSSYCIFK